MTDGASSASPAATSRSALTKSAGVTSLSRNPLAPARSASTTYSSASNVVRTRTRGGVAPAGPSGGEPAGGLDAVHHRHPEVHDHDVRREPGGLVQGGAAVGRLADDRDPGLVREDHPEPGPDQLLVVDEQHADRRHGVRHAVAPSTGSDAAAPAASTGNRAATRKPAPRGPASSVPPNTATRSLHPDQSAAGLARVGQPAARRRPARTAVVDDLHLERVGLVADRDRGPGVDRVLERVGERLLDDPVRRQLHARVQRPRLADHRQLRPEAGRPHLLEQLAQAVEAGHRRRHRVPRRSPSWRSGARIPSIRRMSARARRPLVSIASSAVRASSGRRSSARSPAPAWITITHTWWVTTSWSSRAILARSSATASAARASRSASARRARSSTVPMYRRRSWAHVPTSHTTKHREQALDQPRQPGRDPDLVEDHRAMTAAATERRRDPGRREHCSATVNSATSDPRLELKLPSASIACAPSAEIVIANTATGYRATERERHGLEQGQREAQRIGPTEVQGPAQDR